MTELDIDSDIVRGYVAAARLWWLFLLIGAAWLLFAIVVFRFSYTSVSAISIFFGVVVMVAAIDELFIAFAGGEGGWMKVARLLLALALIVIGILAFVHPGDTFRALAAVTSFYFVLKGMFTTVVGFTSRRLMSLWWLWLLLGLAEILIGFGLPATSATGRSCSSCGSACSPSPAGSARSSSPSRSATSATRSRPRRQISALSAALESSCGGPPACSARIVSNADQVTLPAWRMYGLASSEKRIATSLRSATQPSTVRRSCPRSETSCSSTPTIQMSSHRSVHATQ